MGLWYCVADAAFIGGSTGSVQGHNPWEAAILDCPVIHGPNTENFATDYNTLHEHSAAIKVTNSEQLLDALQNKATLSTCRANAKVLASNNSAMLDDISNKILALISPGQS